MSEYTPVKVRLIRNPTAAIRPHMEHRNAEKLQKSIATKEFKAYQEPPIQLLEALQYKDKPFGLTYTTLYNMSIRDSVIAAIINTRINQVSNFTKLARFNSDGVGYEVRLKDPNKVPTEGQVEIIAALENFIGKCGYSADSDRDTFDVFIRKTIRDSLTYDQMCFEIIRDRMGRPAEFMAVDAATNRAANENYNIKASGMYGGEKPPKASDDVKYVQVIDGMITSWFTSRELAFGVRNPRTSIYMQPYGFSELEQLINHVTSHLFAEEYNEKFFSQGGTTKGIINLKQDPNGVMNQEQMESFKRQWRAQVSGLTGAWKTPVLQVPNGIEYISVSQSNREMEFEKWMNYLINVCCAVFQIDPAEVNFPNNGGSAGNGGSVFESSQESKVKNSKDKGLRPLLRFIEDMINKAIISQFSDDYVFTFKGLNEQSEDEKVELDQKCVRTYKTLNEVRKEHSMEPIPYGDIILDASFMNHVSQSKMMEMQQGAAGAGGEEQQPGEEGQEEQEQSGNEYAGYGEESGNESGNEGSEEQPNTEGSNEYTGYGEEPEEEQKENVNKSMSKMIITID